MSKLPKLGNKKTNMGLRGMGGGGGLLPILPIWQDLFTTDRAVGAVNGSACEPGPGNRVGVDTESKMTINGDNLVFAGGKAVPVTGDPGYWGPVTARASGRALKMKFTHPGVGSYNVGFDINTTTGLTDNFIAFTNNAMYERGAVDLGSLSGAGDVTLWIILATVGSHYVISGPGFTNPTRIWVDHTRNTASIYPALSNNNADPLLDGLGIFDLPAPWNDLYGTVTRRIAGVVVAGTPFAHEANCLIDFTCPTLPSGGVIDLRFRQQDSTNYWQVTVGSTGGLVLNEVSNGTPTQRGISAGVIVNGDIIRVIANGTIIKIYEGASSAPNNLRITYNSAASFQTATAGILSALGTGGSVSDLLSWPYTVSGLAQGILNRANF
jgi:hypothetical protein